MKKKKRKPLSWGDDDYDGWAPQCRKHGFSQGAIYFYWSPEKPGEPASCAYASCVCRWVRVKLVSVEKKRAK